MSSSEEQTTATTATRAERRDSAIRTDDPALLRQLAEDPIWRVRRAVAQNPSTPSDVLELLARDKHPDVRAWVTDHPGCPIQALVILLDDPKTGIRAKAMARPEAPLDHIVRRASRDSFAKEVLAQRARDPAALATLMASADPTLRLIVAQSGAADDNTLRQLVAGTDLRVHLAVANLPTLPKDVVRTLARSKWPMVQWSIAARGDLTWRTYARLFRSNDDRTIRLLAQSPRLPALIVLRVIVFSRLNRRWITTVLASSDSTPRVCAWFLAHSRHWQVRRAVAARPKISRRMMRRLARDKAWSVKATLAHRLDLSPTVQWKLMGGWGPRLALATNPSLTTDIAEALAAARTDEFVSGRVLANPAVSTETLVRQADGLRREPWVLRTIAENPNCPEELRDEILTWLALGGAGNKDPRFDPVTCRSHPGDLKTPTFTFYLELSKTVEGEPEAPLWAARAAKARQVSNEAGRLSRYADDDHVEVRRAVSQGTLQYPLWRAMAWDDDPHVRQVGLRVWGAAHFPRRREVIQSKQWATWYRAKGGRWLMPAIWMGAVIGLGLAFTFGDTAESFRIIPIVTGAMLISRLRRRR